MCLDCSKGYNFRSMNSNKAKLVLCLVAIFAMAFMLLSPDVLAVRPDEGDGSGTSAPNTDTDVCGTSGDRCNNFVETYLNPFIYLLSALVGVAAVISIITAGIQYSSSADDPSTVSKAKQRIFNTVIGLVAYIFLFAFLNYLIPGGLL